MTTLVELDKMGRNCSVCFKYLENIQDFRKHPLLKVALCRGCYEEHCKLNPIENCLWCLKMGDFGCQRCGRYICEECILNNFGFPQILIANIHSWICYVCDPHPLQHSISFCKTLEVQMENEEIHKFINHVIDTCVGDLKEINTFVDALCDNKNLTNSELEAQINVMWDEISSKLTNAQECLKDEPPTKEPQQIAETNFQGPLQYDDIAPSTYKDYSSNKQQQFLDEAVSTSMPTYGKEHETQDGYYREQIIYEAYSTEIERNIQSYPYRSSMVAVANSGEIEHKNEVKRETHHVAYKERADENPTIGTKRNTTRPMEQSLAPSAHFGMSNCKRIKTRSADADIKPNIKLEAHDDGYREHGLYEMHTTAPKRNVSMPTPVEQHLSYRSSITSSTYSGKSDRIRISNDEAANTSIHKPNQRYLSSIKQETEDVDYREHVNFEIPMTATKRNAKRPMEQPYPYRSGMAASTIRGEIKDKRFVGEDLCYRPNMGLSITSGEIKQERFLAETAAKSMLKLNQVLENVRGRQLQDDDRDQVTNMATSTYTGEVKCENDVDYREPVNFKTPFTTTKRNISRLMEQPYHYRSSRVSSTNRGEIKNKRFVGETIETYLIKPNLSSNLREHKPQNINCNNCENYQLGPKAVKGNFNSPMQQSLSYRSNTGLSSISGEIKQQRFLAEASTESRPKPNQVLENVRGRQLQDDDRDQISNMANSTNEPQNINYNEHEDYQMRPKVVKKNLNAPVQQGLHHRSNTGLSIISGEIKQSFSVETVTKSMLKHNKVHENVRGHLQDKGENQVEYKRPTAAMERSTNPVEQPNRSGTTPPSLEICQQKFLESFLTSNQGFENVREQQLQDSDRKQIKYKMPTGAMNKNAPYRSGKALSISSGEIRQQRYSNQTAYMSIKSPTLQDCIASQQNLTSHHQFLSPQARTKKNKQLTIMPVPQNISQGKKSIKTLFQNARHNAKTLLAKNRSNSVDISMVSEDILDDNDIPNINSDDSPESFRSSEYSFNQPNSSFKEFQMIKTETVFTCKTFPEVSETPPTRAPEDIYERCDYCNKKYRNKTCLRKHLGYCSKRVDTSDEG